MYVRQGDVQQMTRAIQTELMTCCLGRKCQNSVDNDTMKIQKDILYVNSYILENIVK